MRRISPLVLSLLALGLLWQGSRPALGEDPPPAELRAFDLAFLEDPVTWPRDAGLGLWWTALGLAEAEDEGPSPPLSPDELVALLRETVHPALWEDGSAASLRLEGTHLVVRAPNAVLDDVSASVDAAWRLMGQRVRLRVQVLAGPGAALDALDSGPLPEALSRGRLDAAARDAFLSFARERGLTGAAAGTDVRPGAWARLKHARTARWLLDYEVEIAQDSVVGNPVVLEAALGWALDLRAQRLPDERLWIDAVVQVAEQQGPAREVDPAASPFGTMDFPALRVLRLSSSARLAPGETLVLLSREGDDLRVVLLEAALVGPEPKPLRMVPLDVGAFTQPRWGCMSSETDRIEGLVLDPVRRLLVGPTVGSGPTAQELLDLVPPSEDAGGRRATETCLWIEPSGADAARRALVALARDLLATERLEARWLEVPADGAPRERARVALDLARGLPFAFEHAVERTYLADWDVEVAQEARCGNPNPGVLRSGLFVSGLLSAATGDGAATLALESLLTAQQGPFETLQPDNDCTGVIERAVLETLRATHDGALARGETVRVELGRDGAGMARVLELRLWR